MVSLAAFSSSFETMYKTNRKMAPLFHSIFNRFGARNLSLFNDQCY